VYLRTFFIVLAAVMALTTAGYYLGTKVLFDKSIPDAPCSMEIANGAFINDEYQKYQFNGAITLWLKNNMITVFGVYDTADGMKKLTRSILLDHIKRKSKVVTADVKSTAIAPSDEVQELESFFASKGEPLTFHFQRIKSGEYLVTINNNWVALCKEH
jgi:hypothetical protein